jgi:hypothetical protein
MKSTHHTLTIFCASALATACASAPTQRAYVAPTSQTVVTVMEEMAPTPGHIIYVENHSSVPVTVYSVTLRDCENIKANCNSPRSINLRLRPNSRTVLARVEPADSRKASHFGYSFGWQADSSAKAALGALAAGGDSNAEQQLDAIARAEAQRRNAVGGFDPILKPSDIAALGDRAQSLRASPDSLVLPVGRRLTLDTIHVLLIGAEGETLGRVGALQWRVGGPSVSVVRPDTIVALAPGRSSLRIMLPADVLPDRPALHAPLDVPIVVRP